MNFHIGEAVRRRAEKLNLGPTALGRMINTSKQNVYGIFRRQSVDTELLYRLSRALKYDFFQEYRKRMREMGEEWLEADDADSRMLTEALEECRSKLEANAEKIRLQEKLIRLMEEKQRA